jgi:hypothetical protein
LGSVNRFFIGLNEPFSIGLIEPFSHWVLIEPFFHWVRYRFLIGSDWTVFIWVLNEPFSIGSDWTVFSLGSGWTVRLWMNRFFIGSDWTVFSLNSVNRFLMGSEWTFLFGFGEPFSHWFWLNRSPFVHRVGDWLGVHPLGATLVSLTSWVSLTSATDLAPSGSKQVRDTHSVQRLYI